MAGSPCSTAVRRPHAIARSRKSSSSATLTGGASLTVGTTSFTTAMSAEAIRALPARRTARRRGTSWNTSWSCRPGCRAEERDCTSEHATARALSFFFQFATAPRAGERGTRVHTWSCAGALTLTRSLVRRQRHVRQTFADRRRLAHHLHPAASPSLRGSVPVPRRVGDWFSTGLPSRPSSNRT
jgi:hypothetical protein